MILVSIGMCYLESSLLSVAGLPNRINPLPIDAARIFLAVRGPISLQQIVASSDQFTKLRMPTMCKYRA